LERAKQPESEIYRVIVLNQAGTELLLASIEGSASLPEVTIPRWQRAAENIGAAMKSTWGEEVICLFEPDGATPDDSQDRIHYQVTEYWGRVGKSEAPTRWVRIEDLHQNSFVDALDYAAIQRSLAERETLARDPVAGPFAQLGWFKELVKWVEEVLAPRGHHLSGNFQQLNASPSFSLIRFGTDGRAVWFKAVGAPNQREFPITLTLARLFPDYVPQTLGTRPTWNGWLMSEAKGTQLDETTDQSLWEATATTLANLQVKSIHGHRELLDCGVHDLRIKSIRQLVSPFMSVIGTLMEKQTKIQPPPVSEIELQALGGRIQDALSLLGELGIPDALGHLDANPGNIIFSRNRFTFLDWAEAYVGHPFFTFQYLLEHFRRNDATDATSEAKLAASYLVPWEQITSHDCLAEAMSYAPLLAAFAFALGTEAWREPERVSDRNVAGYLRSLVRRMNREARELSERRLLCPG
jgi:Phosphotransferase enzyme family